MPGTIMTRLSAATSQRARQRPHTSPTRGQPADHARPVRRLVSMQVVTERGRDVPPAGRSTPAQHPSPVYVANVGPLRRSPVP